MAAQNCLDHSYLVQTYGQESSRHEHQIPCKNLAGSVATLLFHSNQTSAEVSAHQSWNWVSGPASKPVAALGVSSNMVKC